MFERPIVSILSTKTVKIIKPLLIERLNHLKGKWTGIHLEYGILGIAAAAAVPLKLLLFYALVGIAANFFPVWLVTCALTYILFASFKNKWIPAAIYLLLSVLMLCDLTYNSFFNRYLSVNMLGAAGVLGDITESIKEVLKPWFFLILADAALALAALTARYRRLRTRELIAQDTKTPVQAGAETETPESAGETLWKGIVLSWVSDHKKQVAALIILCLLVFNSSASFLITSVSNQEIYSYHIKDVMNMITGNSVLDKDSGHMYAVSDSYAKEKDGPLFGLAKGRNLIVIQIESFQNFVVNKKYNGREITPNLNEIIRGNTVYFDRYYQQIGSGNTSDAEFATNNSIYGSIQSYTYKLYPDNYFRGLPVLLKEQGYETAVFHAHEDRDFWNRDEAYDSLGFDTFYGGIGGTDIGQFDMTEWMGWGLTDSEFYKQVMVYMKELTRPFYSFIITLSNHHPYIMLDHYRFIELLPEDEGTIFGNYLNSVAYTDYAIGLLMQELKEEGIYEESIIAIYGDHLGLPKSDEEIFESVSRFIGKDYDFDTMMNIPLIITVPGAEKNIHQTVSTAGGQLDFLPTVAYLMGFESLDTVYLGHNLLTVDSGFAAEQTYMVKGSFFSDDAVYEMSRDGVFENGRAWDPETGEPLPVKDCYEGYLKSVGLINTCEFILKNDVLRSIYEKKQDIISVFSGSASEEQYFPDKIAKAGAPDKNLIGTNSMEALNASYDAGYRHIGIDICWTEDKEAVLLRSWKELDDYFDTSLEREVTLKKFDSLQMKNGLTSMNFLDLISWVKEHPDVTIYAQAERSADWFMKCMESYAGSIISQFVSLVLGMAEYSGLYPSVLVLEAGGNTADQLLEFIELNNVPAVSMSRQEAAGEYKKILKEADCVIYVKDERKGILLRKK